METEKYLHGYSEEERNRLNAQAGFLEEMIYEFLELSSCKEMLEIGCGTGAHSKILLNKYPHLHITAVDINQAQITKAKKDFESLPHLKDRIQFHVGDGNELFFEKESFDSIFIVWVLEHVKDPLRLLKNLLKFLKPGGRIYLTEVYNDSLYISPAAPFQMEYFRKFCELQKRMGGDPIVGMKLGNLLHDAGYGEIMTRNLNRHYDKRNIEDKIKMFDYWKSLLLSAKDNLLAEKMIDENFVKQTFEEIDLIKEIEDSIFYYCPIQAEAVKSN